MRRLSRTTAAATFLAATRWCATSNAGPTIAPKRAKRRTLSEQLPDIEQTVKSAQSTIPKEDPKVEANLSTDEMAKHMEELSKLSPEELESQVKGFEKQEDQESRVLQEDSVYQMDVSLKPRLQGGTRVFWKNVSVVPYMKESHQGWYAVACDGRNVKAFESKSVLAVPSEEYALAMAREWADQEKHLNKLNMPLTDLASGAQHVAPQAIGARIDYLMSFFNNDNCYYRAEAIQDKQDEMLKPALEWFERVFDVQLPRIVGIGHPNITPDQTNQVRDALYAMEMNPYQIVALCVVAQFTASLVLPMALFHGVIDLPTALKINRAEEFHNVSTEGEIKGYHDIREADSVVKICASATAWKAFADVPLARCAEIPRIIDEEDLV